MGRLILQEWLSLDGSAVDAEGTLDFFPESETDRYRIATSGVPRHRRHDPPGAEDL